MGLNSGSNGKATQFVECKLADTATSPALPNV